MNDEEIRLLERSAKGGDMRARAALTEHRLLGGRGLVALWRPPHQAPPDAIPASLSFKVRGAFVRANGCALAVLDLEDAMSIIGVDAEMSPFAAPAELVDLDTGSCLRVSGSAVRPPSAMAGKVGRSRDNGIMLVEHHLFDRMLVGEPMTTTSFFYFPQGSGIPGRMAGNKTAADTNLVQHSCIPTYMEGFRAWGLSVIPDADAPEDALSLVRDASTATLVLRSGMTMFQGPLRLLLPRRDGPPDASSIGIDRAPPVHVFSDDIVIERGESVELRLDTTRLPAGGVLVGLMAVLHGRAAFRVIG